jgi:hypothetical protein
VRQALDVPVQFDVKMTSRLFHKNHGVAALFIKNHGVAALSLESIDSKIVDIFRFVGAQPGHCWVHAVVKGLSLFWS